LILLLRKSKIIRFLETKVLDLEKQRDELYTVCHNIGARVSAMELSVAQLSDSAGDETISVKTDLTELSRKSSNDLYKVIPRSILPKTGIRVLDNIFKYFNAECERQSINFQLKFLEPVTKLPHSITADELCELAINLVENAIKAVKSSQKSIRSIHINIGTLRGNFILSVIDSGENFTPEVLMKLGTERISTGYDNGGGGFGYMSIFESMEIHKASLTIHELPPSDEGFSKSVTISFDTQQKYIIKTSRSKAFVTGETYRVVHDG